MGLCRMKGGFDILLKLKLGCHKNNKNVKKLSAMLKKYPKEMRRIFTATHVKQKSGRAVRACRDGRQAGIFIQKWIKIHFRTYNIHEVILFVALKEI